MQWRIFRGRKNYSSSAFSLGPLSNQSIAITHLITEMMPLISEGLDFGFYYFKQLFKASLEQFYICKLSVFKIHFAYQNAVTLT